MGHWGIHDEQCPYIKWKKVKDKKVEEKRRRRHYWYFE